MNSVCRPSSLASQDIPQVKVFRELGLLPLGQLPTVVALSLEMRAGKSPPGASIDGPSLGRNQSSPGTIWGKRGDCEGRLGPKNKNYKNEWVCHNLFAIA